NWDDVWTFIGEHFSQHTSYGVAKRAGFGQTSNSVGGTAVNDVAGTSPAWAPAAGEVKPAISSPAGLPTKPPITNALVQGGPQNLHGQAYGAAIDSQGNADCETGQRGYVKKLNP